MTHVFDLLIVLGGMAASLVFVALAAPLYLRALLPSSPVTDPGVVRLLEGVFARAGFRAPAFRVFDPRRTRMHNAAIAGLRWGRGPFTPTVFFTRSLLTELTREELEAVMLHEVSHLSLGHVRRRLVAGFAAFLASAALILAAVAASVLLAPAALKLVVPSGALVSLGIQVWWVRRAVRGQELEADANALRLGASPAALESALRKLHALNGPRKREFSAVLDVASAHPALDERVAALKEAA